MKVSDLEFEFPEELIAVSPSRPSRVMWVDESKKPVEINIENLLLKFKTDDVLILNNTQVLKRRVFADSVEILFLKQLNATDWEVLFPSKKYKVGDSLNLPQGVTLTLLAKGRPQKVRMSEELQESYFQEVAELPLPPYIQKARKERHTIQSDETWYQTAWASKPGSFAAPTASLHFSQNDLDLLSSRGVKICEVTLHVGLGTFLPVQTDDLDDHDMHEEYVEISAEVWNQIQTAKTSGHNVWALGTTATRSVESAACGLLSGDAEVGFSGFTKLLMQPGYHFKIVDRLLTNFHQPQSTLLALVSAFSSLEVVKSCYKWAVERKFRLFSYGDLSCWVGKPK